MCKTPTGFWNQLSSGHLAIGNFPNAVQVMVVGYGRGNREHYRQGDWHEWEPSS
tara:strand:+ start:564 stop:725 length:162 start_codon:yes stop_codon:yes gene_type:complete